MKTILPVKIVLPKRLTKVILWSDLYYYFIDRNMQDFLNRDSFCLSVSYLVIRMIMEMLLGDARVLGVALFPRDKM